MNAVVVAADILTPFGKGIDSCWSALLENRSAISPVTRFATGAFFSNYGATIPDLVYHGETSLVMQMLSRLLDGAHDVIPGDARLLLATIKGEIDVLERSVLEGVGDPAASAPGHLLAKVVDLLGTRGESAVISAACASSSSAVARAAAMIRAGRTDCVLVVACDSVTEFVFSGFSSLMALDKEPARPFDKQRAGLSIGEAAGYLLLMSRERAEREGRTILGEITGWGMSDDANHMTGPCRESEGLIRAIRAALKSAGMGPERVGFISAHGTGTQYNDAMEMRAFHGVFGERALPVYSVKGGLGHTMGAAGLVEIALAQRAQREGVVPPTVNLSEPDDDACGWVSSRCRSVPAGSVGMVTNAGFSGINTALILV